MNLVSARASTPAKGTGAQDPVSSLCLSRTSPTRLHLTYPLDNLPYPYHRRRTIRSHQHGPKYEDDGGICSHEEPEPEGSDDEDKDPNPNANLNVLPLLLSQMYEPPLHAPIQTPVPAPTQPAPIVQPVHVPTPIHPSPPIQTPVPVPVPAAPVVRPAPVPLRPAITIVSTPASPTTANQTGLRSKPGSPGYRRSSSGQRPPSVFHMIARRLLARRPLLLALVVVRTRMSDRVAGVGVE